jgi:hypothetical protein
VSLQERWVLECYWYQHVESSEQALHTPTHVTEFKELKCLLTHLLASVFSPLRQGFLLKVIAVWSKIIWIQSNAEDAMNFDVIEGMLFISLVRMIMSIRNIIHDVWGFVITFSFEDSGALGPDTQISWHLQMKAIGTFEMSGATQLDGSVLYHRWPETPVVKSTKPTSFWFHKGLSFLFWEIQMLSIKC